MSYVYIPAGAAMPAPGTIVTTSVPLPVPAAPAAPEVTDMDVALRTATLKSLSEVKDKTLQDVLESYLRAQWNMPTPATETKSAPEETKNDDSKHLTVNGRTFLTVGDNGAFVEVLKYLNGVNNFPTYHVQRCVENGTKMATCLISRHKDISIVIFTAEGKFFAYCLRGKGLILQNPGPFNELMAPTWVNQLATDLKKEFNIGDC